MLPSLHRNPSRHLASHSVRERWPSVSLTYTSSIGPPWEAHRGANSQEATVRQLETDIRAFIDRHNQNPKPFKSDQILASRRKLRIDFAP
jgi:hypothetical protein